MSSIKLELSHISERILELSASYATDKAFLKECEISNLSFITDVRKGRANAPGADKLAQIVRGTGCSGTWLLTGEGEMYPPRENGPAKAADGGVGYVSRVLQLKRLIENLEQHKADLKNVELPKGLALQAAQLTAMILEIQQAGDSDSD